MASGRGDPAATAAAFFDFLLSPGNRFNAPAEVNAAVASAAANVSRAEPVFRAPVLLLRQLLSTEVPAVGWDATAIAHVCERVFRVRNPSEAEAAIPELLARKRPLFGALVSAPSPTGGPPVLGVEQLAIGAAVLRQVRDFAAASESGAGSYAARLIARRGGLPVEDIAKQHGLAVVMEVAHQAAGDDGAAAWASAEARLARRVSELQGLLRSRDAAGVLGAWRYDAESQLLLPPGAAPPIPAPRSGAGAEAEQLSAIRQQLTHYFSPRQYSRDMYLRSLEDAGGWIPLASICDFRRMQALGAGPELAARSLRMAGPPSGIELRGDGTHVRRAGVARSPPVEPPVAGGDAGVAVAPAGGAAGPAYGLQRHLRTAILYVLSNAHLGTDADLLAAHTEVPGSTAMGAPFSAVLRAALALVRDDMLRPPALCAAAAALIGPGASEGAAAEAALAVQASIRAGEVDGLAWVEASGEARAADAAGGAGGSAAAGGGAAARGSQPLIARVDDDGAPLPLPYVPTLVQRSPAVLPGSASDGLAPGAPQLRCMTYNLLGPQHCGGYQYTNEGSLQWEHRRARIIAEVRFHRPHVVAFQELATMEADPTTAAATAQATRLAAATAQARARNPSFPAHPRARFRHGRDSDPAAWVFAAMRTLGYEGIFRSKGAGAARLMNGEALFYRTDTLQPAEVPEPVGTCSYAGILKDQLRRRRGAWRGEAAEVLNSSAAHALGNGKGIAWACLTLRGAAGRAALPLLFMTTHFSVALTERLVQVMQARAMVEALAAKRAQVAAAARVAPEDIPVVVMGDFNAVHDGAVYSLLATGRIDPAHPDLASLPAKLVVGGARVAPALGRGAGAPPGSEGDWAWDCFTSPLALRSAYRAVLGREPLFTNYKYHADAVPAAAMRAAESVVLAFGRGVVPADAAGGAAPAGFPAGDPTALALAVLRAQPWVPDAAAGSDGGGWGEGARGAAEGGGEGRGRRAGGEEEGAGAGGEDPGAGGEGAGAAARPGDGDEDEKEDEGGEGGANGTLGPAALPGDGDPPAGAQFLFAQTLDYVFVSAGDRLRVSSVLEMPPLPCLTEEVALPSTRFPSDHLPLMACFFLS